MDKSIQILKETVLATKLVGTEKTRVLQGLRRFVPLDAKNS
jgi:hypothetical protein